MAELMTRDRAAEAPEILAEYRASNGVRVTLVMDSKTKRLGPGEMPAWVEAGRQIQEASARRYWEATGKMPSLALMRAFERDQGAALNRHLDSPDIPYQPMTIKEYEEAHHGSKN